MPRLDQSVIREIHTRIDIATFIGQYVSLRKRGRDLVGLCPFHGEKTPSLHVHPEEGYFKCFGCGAGGDVIAFVMKLENLPFGDAARVLANKAGIALESEDPRAARRRNEREAIYEANAIAAAYFERMLRGQSGASARAYCEKRGFGEAIVERFHLGYAPDGWNGLTDELAAHGVDLQVAEKAGLVKPSQRGGYYDFYRNRLMVPTYATTGEVIAFGGRELGAGEPKYLNTSTTPVYTKGEHLFALNIARRAAQGDRTLIVVEGYLDCIALHQAGFENTVAALGTAFTEKQATELRKYADNIFLCFDGDLAGGSAATKGEGTASKGLGDYADSAFERSERVTRALAAKVDIKSAISASYAGMSVRIVMLPEGEDPDSFVRSNGAAAFRALLDKAKPTIELRLDRRIKALASGFESHSAIAREAEAVIRELTPREEWDRWRVYVAGRLKVNVDDLRNSRFLANSANFLPRSDGASATGSRHVATSARSGPVVNERQMLAIFLEDPELVSEFSGRLAPEQFGDGLHRSIFERMRASADSLKTPADVFAMFAEDSAALEVLSTLLYRADKAARGREERQAHLEGVINSVLRSEEERRCLELDREIARLYESGQVIPHEIRAEFEALKLKLSY